MISLADALKDAVIKRDLTDDERHAVADILDAAAEWAAGDLPLHAFSEVGKLPAWDSKSRRVESAGYGRCLALMATPRADPRWRCLKDAIGALVREQHVVATTQGVFERKDLFEAGVTVK